MLTNNKAAKKAFVIGHPIFHSLSPKLHGYWLKEMGIDGNYEAINCPPEYFVKTIKKLAETGYAGGNVTIPFKEKALMICDEVDEVAKKIGAVNTLVFKNGKVFGYNTDAFGFKQNLVENGVDFVQIKQALVLGAGGAARAVIEALKPGVEKIIICNRTLENAKKLAKEFKTEAQDWQKIEAHLKSTNLLINTTSVGMKGQGSLEIDLSKLPKNAVVTDIVYNPLETKLLADAKTQNLKTVDGLGMLIHQAASGFEKWFGQKPKVSQELYDYLAAQIK